MVGGGGIPLPQLTHLPNDGRAVVLGLRAEDIGPSPTGPVLRGLVDTAMQAGSDQFIGLMVEGALVFVRVGKDTKVRQGEAAAFGLDPARLHLFEKASGRSLLLP